MNEYRFAALLNMGFNIVSHDGNYALVYRNDSNYDQILHWDGENWSAV